MARTRDEDDELRDLDAELDVIDLGDEDDDEEEFQAEAVGECAAGEKCRFGGTVYEEPESGHALEGRCIVDGKTYHAGCHPAGQRHAKGRARARRKYERSAVAQKRAATAREV